MSRGFPRNKEAREIWEKRPSSEWFFTCNNYTDDHINKVKELGEDWWFIIGKECGKQGTKHLQGVIWHKKDVKFTRDIISAILGTQFHLERCKLFEESVGYCLKEGDIITNTIFPQHLDHFHSELHLYTSFSTCPNWLYWFWVNYSPSNTHTRPEVSNFWDLHHFNHH